MTLTVLGLGLVFAALHAFARTDGHLTVNLLAALLSAPIGLLLGALLV